MAEIKMSAAAMRKLEREAAKKLSATVQVPTGGSEADAVRAVRDQLRAEKKPYSEAEARKLVREARK